MEDAVVVFEMQVSRAAYRCHQDFKTLSFETPPALYPKPLNPNAFFCPADAVPIGATSWRRVRLWVVEVCLPSADLPKVLGP